MRYKIIFIFFLLASMPVHADWQQPELSHNLTPVKNVISASDFELPDMDEEKVKLSKYRGKVVLLNFWATWCPPCIAELPEVQKIYDAYGDRVKFFESY